VSVTTLLATKHETAILLELWQLYLKDLSEFRDLAPQPDGRYRADRLRTYLSYEDHWAYLIRKEDEIAGFSLVRRSKPETLAIGEFFILPKFRRSGVGRSAVVKLLTEFKGDWEISFQNENAAGAIFWRHLISDLGYVAEEVSTAVIGRPDLPHDVWLSFTS
jgi:predicted acetyltransferase